MSYVRKTTDTAVIESRRGTRGGWRITAFRHNVGTVESAVYTCRLLGQYRRDFPDIEHRGRIIRFAKKTS